MEHVNTGWEIASAIGTLLAAFVGIAGIWLNLCDKKRRLSVSFELLPEPKLFVCNCSQRAVVVTKMVGFVGERVIYAKLFNGLTEIILQPFTVKILELDFEDIVQQYKKLGRTINDEVIVVLYDNYGRKYRTKIGLTIDDLKGIV